MGIQQIIKEVEDDYIRITAITDEGNTASGTYHKDALDCVKDDVTSTTIQSALNKD